MHYSESEIQQRLRKQIKSLLSPIEIKSVKQQYHIQNQRIADLVVKTRYNNKDTLFVIKVKSIGEPRHIEQAITQVKLISKVIPNSYPVVASSFISETSREICKKLNVGYVDLFGNIYIDLPQIHIEKETKKTKQVEKKKQKKLFSPVATRIIRSLLSEPAGQWTIQSLSEKSEVSLGYAHRIVEKLIDKKFLERNKDYKLIFIDKSGLLDSWRDSYTFKNNKIYSYYTFEKNKNSLFNEIKKTSQLIGSQYALTLHSGASLIAPYVRYTDVHLYIKNDMDKWVQKLDLRPVESGANIYFIEPYDKGVMQNLQTIKGNQIVSNIQLYLDLYSYPKRGREQAEKIREEKINF
ncbi:MAG TPA: type IV toxin-antitoxin system AbiEi family antitoxin [Candidatus Thermoplasmatota archaeon]|nr:type IV toxin-antitoxin system AbiEi family antitoxin [Candidatus Thermoplasmatota archaeon]